MNDTRKGFELCKKYRNQFNTDKDLLMCEPELSDENQAFIVFVCYPNKNYNISEYSKHSKYSRNRIWVTQYKQKETPVIPIDKKGVVMAWDTVFSSKPFEMGLKVPGIKPTVNYVVTGSGCFTPISEKVKLEPIWRMLYEGKLEKLERENVSLREEVTELKKALGNETKR